MDDSMLWRVLVATEDFYMTEFLTQDYIMELENDTGIPLNNCVDIFKGDEFKIFKPYPISFIENHKITIYYLALRNNDPNMMYLIKESDIGKKFSFIKLILIPPQILLLQVLSYIYDYLFHSILYIIFLQAILYLLFF